MCNFIISVVRDKLLVIEISEISESDTNPFFIHQSSCDSESINSVICSVSPHHSYLSKYSFLFACLVGECNIKTGSVAPVSVDLEDSPTDIVILHIFPPTSRRAKEVRSRDHPQEPPAQTRPVWSPSSRLLHPASCASGRLRLRPELQCLVCVQQPV